MDNFFNYSPFPVLSPLSASETILNKSLSTFRVSLCGPLTLTAISCPNTSEILFAGAWQLTSGYATVGNDSSNLLLPTVSDQGGVDLLILSLMRNVAGSAMRWCCTDYHSCREWPVIGCHASLHRLLSYCPSSVMVSELWKRDIG